MTGQHGDDGRLTSITIVCSSPRHSRGKVAVIARFTAEYDINDGRRVGWGKQTPPRNRRERRLREYLDRWTPPSQRTGDYFAYGPQLDTVARGLRCKLCGIEIRRPNDAELDSLARQGVSRVELSQLRHW